MPLFNPRFIAVMMAMHQRIRERPDWISRVIVFSTLAFAVLIVLFVRDHSGQRF